MPLVRHLTYLGICLPKNAHHMTRSSAGLFVATDQVMVQVRNLIRRGEGRQSGRGIGVFAKWQLTSLIRNSQLVEWAP